MEKKSLSTLSASLLTYFVMLTLFILIRVVFLYVSIPLSSSVSDLITTIFIQVGVMFFLCIFMYSKVRHQNLKTTLGEFGYSKIGFMPIIISILIGIVCYFLNMFIASFFSSIISLCGYESVPQFSGGSGDYSVMSFILQVISVALLPAICEETAHRGLLLNGLKPMGIVRAMLISSLLFGLMHLNINQFFYATILGFIISISVVSSKNILPAILIHFMNNFLSTYFSFASHNNWVGGDIPTLITNFIYGGGNLFSYFITSLLFLAALVLVLVLLFTWLFKETRIKAAAKLLSDISNINKEFVNPNSTIYRDENLIAMYQINKLMSDYNIKSLNKMIFTDIESSARKLTKFELIFLVACIVVGGFVTLSTFIWGVL